MTRFTDIIYEENLLDFKNKIQSTKNFDIEHKYGTENATLLEIACFFNKPAIAEFLIKDYNADVNTGIDKGVGILYTAMGRSKIEIVKLLIENGADTEFITKDGKTFKNFMNPINRKVYLEILENTSIVNLNLVKS
jgi:ankyrin repeat protein